MIKPTQPPAIPTFDALFATLRSIKALPELLAAYEATGDHNHGRGSIKPGAPCPGGDCIVSKARKIIAAAAATGALDVGF